MLFQYVILSWFCLLIQSGINFVDILVYSMYIFRKSEQAKSTYDAVEKDAAHVNIFFGQNHCMGECKTIRAAKNTSSVQSTNATNPKMTGQIPEVCSRQRETKNDLILA